MDVIRARDHIWLLNEVFTNPTIMKVLHGADHDIVWLQKDFGVYMVGFALLENYHSFDWLIDWLIDWF